MTKMRKFGSGGAHFDPAGNAQQATAPASNFLPATRKAILCDEGTTLVAHAAASDEGVAFSARSKSANEIGTPFARKSSTILICQEGGTLLRSRHFLRASSLAPTRAPD